MINCKDNANIGDLCVLNGRKVGKFAASIERPKTKSASARDQGLCLWTALGLVIGSRYRARHGAVPLPRCCGLKSPLVSLYVYFFALPCGHKSTNEGEMQHWICLQTWVAATPFSWILVATWCSKTTACRGLRQSIDACLRTQV